MNQARKMKSLLELTARVPTHPSEDQTWVSGGSAAPEARGSQLAARAALFSTI